jgi:hypothetical protein
MRGKKKESRATEKHDKLLEANYIRPLVDSIALSLSPSSDFDTS